MSAATYSISLENDKYVTSEHGKPLSGARFWVKEYKNDPRGWTIRVSGPDGWEMFCLYRTKNGKRVWKRSKLSTAKIA